jgi:hypothetical protein
MKYLATLLTLLLVNVAFAQDFYDALRYSQTEYGGTARSIAMGSAFGALGGDFASASINPAGIGLYRSGEFTLSPTLNMNQVEANYLGNTEQDNKYNFNFNNLSYVSTLKTDGISGIVSINFGVGYNRLKNFHSNRYIQGYDANTTLLNYYTDYANDIMNPDNFDYFHEGLAWNTWLIDEDSDPEVIEGVFYNDLTNNYEPYEIYDENNNYLGIGYEATGVKPHQQKALISNSGRIDEYLMSLGLNFNHKIYVGASVGLNDLQFSQDILYSEIDNNNESEYLKNYTVNHQMDESGFGVNFKAGVIFRPVKSLRLGAAIHTPTFYTISRYSYKEITSNFDQPVGADNNILTSTDETDMEPYEYKLETPLKANISAAYILGTTAIFSADYEIVSYSAMKFRDAGDNWDYSANNSDINSVYNTTGNLRIGAEVRATPNFSLRAGYNLMGNPWNSSYTYENGIEESLLNYDDAYSSYSAGMGYRNNNFFVDFAYRLNHSEYSYKVHETYYTNPSGGTANAILTELNHQATLTLGFRF